MLYKDCYSHIIISLSFSTHYCLQSTIVCYHDTRLFNDTDCFICVYAYPNHCLSAAMASRINFYYVTLACHTLHLNKVPSPICNLGTWAVAVVLRHLLMWDTANLSHQQTSACICLFSILQYTVLCQCSVKNYTQPKHCYYTNRSKGRDRAREFVIQHRTLSELMQWCMMQCRCGPADLWSGVTMKPQDRGVNGCSVIHHCKTFNTHRTCWARDPVTHQGPPWRSAAGPACPTALLVPDVSESPTCEGQWSSNPVNKQSVSRCKISSHQFHGRFIYLLT